MKERKDLPGPRYNRPSLTTSSEKAVGTVREVARTHKISRRHSRIFLGVSCIQYDTHMVCILVGLARRCLIPGTDAWGCPELLVGRHV